MKGNFFLGAHSFELRDFDPGMPGPGEVLIRNMAAGICGTDVHIYHGSKGSADVIPPVVLGHEYSGVVEAVGEGVVTVKPGDCVTVDPNIYCGTCRFCRNGQKQFCERMGAIGVNRNGGFAEKSVVPQSQVFAMNPEIGFEAMAMAEPLACCIHGIEQVAIGSGDLVCVVGGGAIGLLLMQLARLRGAAQVIVSEPVAARREIAMSLGASGAIDPTSGSVNDQLEALTGRRCADVILEAVGKTVATQQAFDLADRGARLLLFSVPEPDATFQLPMFKLFQHELKIYGSFINPDSHLQAVNLLNAGKIQVAPMITHRYPLAQLEDAIQMQMSAQSIKVLVLPQQ